MILPSHQSPAWVRPCFTPISQLLGAVLTDSSHLYLHLIRQSGDRNEPANGQWFKYSSEYPVAQPQLVGTSCYNSTLSPSDTICSIDPQLLHPLSLFRVTKVIRGSTQNSFLPVPILRGKGLFKTTIPLLLKVSYHFLP